MKDNKMNSCSNSIPEPLFFGTCKELSCFGERFSTVKFYQNGKVFDKYGSLIGHGELSKDGKMLSLIIVSKD